MAYTIKQARPVLLNYLGLTEANASFIEDTDNWGILYDKNTLKCVIFMMPLGENTSSPKVYFDVRDSGAEKFVAAWEYAEKNDLKFFCLGVKDENETYKNNVVSVEADIKTVLKVSGLENGRRSGSGTQLNIPRKLVPNGNVARAKSDKFAIFFAVIHKDFLGTYLEIFDNRLFQFIKSENVVNSKEIFSGKTPEPLILYGPPGTGKTYRMQHDFIDKFAKEDSFVTTLHQSFSYEEFVEGLKPVLSSVNNTDGTSSDVKYTIEKGIFYKACERAAELAGYSSLQECVSASDRKAKMQEAIDSHKIVLLCIDEINRANVSAVFGDLISLIEPSKRLGSENEMTVFLPYSKETFAVPANLMIVGTMNTADRSIQLLDSALRRRFRFEELLPDYSKVENQTAKEILQKINARIRCLLDKDHQIGHSYFIEAKTDFDIFNALKDCVIPLLEEYFYNDTQKIRQILNEKDDSETNFYVKDDEAEEASSGMQNDFDDDKKFYQLNPKLSEVKDDAVAAQFLTHITAKTAE